MRLALSQFCFPGLSPTAFLKVAATAGAEGCELDIVPGLGSRDLGALAAAVRASGLKVEIVCALRDWALPDDAGYAERFDRLVEAAAELASPWVLCVAPIRYEGLPSRADVLSSAAERLGALAEIARSAGVGVALEQVGLPSTQPGATSGIRSLTDALQVVEAADPAAALVLDSYNLATGGNALCDVADVPRKRIAIAQVADGRPTGSPTRLLPGKSKLPLGDYVGALQRARFDGALSVEIFPDRPHADPLAFARQALRATRALLLASRL